VRKEVQMHMHSAKEIGCLEIEPASNNNNNADDRHLALL
jgi:hypothetical protein